MKNKNLLILLVVAFLGTFLVSCSDDTDNTINYSGGETLKITDPYLQIGTPVVSFQAGIPEYNYELTLINAVNHVSKLNVYKQFTEAGTLAKSERILFKSYDISNESKMLISETFNSDDLKTGLSVSGNQLPSNDELIPTGSSWTLTFEAETDHGVQSLAGSIRVAVLSVYAGIYKVIDSEYFRIGESYGGWNGETRFIGSVDENTFSYNDAWGYFAWAGKSFDFDLNEDNSITVPLINSSGLFSGNRALRCDIEPQTFTSVSCAGSNVLIPDPAAPTSKDGKHIIKLTYGYFTDGSGPREFYEVLEKQ
ncbi:MAG: hypothetical protein H6572_02565 [Lewinellaceae bacterium]|nr:hypothetical protein [Lewinellaceae bacterium]